MIAVQDVTEIENSPFPGIVHQDSFAQCVESDLLDGGRNRHITEVFTPLESGISYLLQVISQVYVPETVTVFEGGILYFQNRVGQYKGRDLHPIESLPVNDGDGVRLAFVFHPRRDNHISLNLLSRSDGRPGSVCLDVVDGA